MSALAAQDEANGELIALPSILPDKQLFFQPMDSSGGAPNRSGESEVVAVSCNHSHSHSHSHAHACGSHASDTANAAQHGCGKAGDHKKECKHTHKHEHDHDHEHGHEHEHQHDLEYEHCHLGARSSEIDRRALTQLSIASVMCLLFMIGEVVGGVLANSLAVMTDAAHMLTDFFSFLISLFALFLSSRRRTHKFLFGWHRAEVVGALFSVFLIWIVTGVLVYLAVRRVVSNNYEVTGLPMLITAGLAVVFNIFMGVVLHPPHGHHGHSHSHNHGHEHAHESSHSCPAQREERAVAQPAQDSDDTRIEFASTSSVPTRSGANAHTSCEPERTSTSQRKAASSQRDDASLLNNIDEENAHDNESPTTTTRKLNKRAAVSKPCQSHGHSHAAHSHSHENLNVRSAFIHVLGDLIQSIGVFVAALIIFIKPEWKIADPICTFLFSALVLFTTFNILYDTLLVLMEGCPRDVNVVELRDAVMAIDRDNILAVHDLRIWSLTLSRRSLSVHIVSRKLDAQSEKTTTRIRMHMTKMLRDRFDIDSLTVQFENQCEGMDQCASCQLNF